MWQVPSAWQGVLMSKRAAVMGEAVLRARCRAAVTSCATLFSPITKITFLGPQVMAATRLPLPSILTMTPSSLMALALDR